jgi:hypothetical protein
MIERPTVITALIQESVRQRMKTSSKGPIMIKKVKGGYKVTSEKGKNLGGPYKTREEAAKRLRQVEFFKHNKG